MFTSCEVAFYKLSIYDVYFTNYHHTVESDFKGTKFHKLSEKAILTKYILTFDNWNTNWPNAIETLIKRFDLLNSCSYRNFSSYLVQ